MATNNSSARIHVETFEVGLGASMLLQFRTDDGVVRVLADGGVHSNPDDHVLGKLPKAIASFGDDPVHIDLVIGTHYDADHLRGLVPIINSGISIEEAWLPPVANDEEPFADDVPGDRNLLALQLAGEDGARILAEYLHAKARNCTEIAEAEEAADEFAPVERSTTLRELHLTGYPADNSLAFFEGHIQAAHETIGTPATGHADEEVVEPADLSKVYEDSEAQEWRWRHSFSYSFPSLRRLAESWSHRSDAARKEAISLAFIRKSEAKKAINAIHLSNVVKALKARRIKMRCATIPTGKPRRFVWDVRAKRFVPTAQASGPIVLTLLGPSIGLVKKHRDKLPLGSYAAFIAREPLPVKHTTPSNELSYVALFSFERQQILISGDTSFTDFRPERTRDYYPALLAKLNELHVVQVAHHGGANGYFYDALMESRFPEQEQRAYLLLSHGVKDPSRPSSVFGQFIEQVRTDKPNITLLFTSQPLDKWVRDFRAMIAPPTVKPPRDRGDVRLVYDGATWEVQQHCVRG